MTIKDMYPAQSVNSERKFVEKLVGTKITLDLPLDINKLLIIGFLISHLKKFKVSDRLVLAIFYYCLCMYLAVSNSVRPEFCMVATTT